ncbi:MAG: HD domain-containing protein [Anaerolineae bacterium]|jgi:uncharacterized protein
MTTERQTALITVETWVREQVKSDKAVAHGWLHTDRVRRNIRLLAAAEGIDPVLAEIAALLHDVGRTLPGPESEHGARSAAMAEPLLAGLPLSEDERRAVLYAVSWHNSKRDDTPLLRILRDADMLDALGATGIMRAYMSNAHRPPYDTGAILDLDAPFDLDDIQQPSLFASDQVRRQLKFYDWLNTDTARQIAGERAAFMRSFLTQMRRELST